MVLDLCKFLYVINDCIECFFSCEQVIGYVYLLGLFVMLGGVFSVLCECILLLLEEYFFEDWSKICEVFGDESKVEVLQFIYCSGLGFELCYCLNFEVFENIEVFIGVYVGVSD